VYAITNFCTLGRVLSDFNASLHRRDGPREEREREQRARLSALLGASNRTAPPRVESVEIGV